MLSSYAVLERKFASNGCINYFQAPQPQHSCKQQAQDGCWHPTQQECSQGLLQHTEEFLEWCSPPSNDDYVTRVTEGMLVRAS